MSTDHRTPDPIPEECTWDLSDLYPDFDAWNDARQRVAAEMTRLRRFHGRLGSSAAELLDALESASVLERAYLRVRAWALMSSDQDTRDSRRLALSQEARRLGTELSAATSFIEPEILALDEARLKDFIAKEPGLQVYQFRLDNLLRRKPHMGTADEERLIAASGLMAEGARNIYNVFTNADLPWQDVELSDGRRVKLNPPAYRLQRSSPVREDRAKVYKTFFGSLDTWRRSIGAMLDADVKTRLFTIGARRYDSCLEAALDVNNIPVEVYHSLLDNVHAALPSFHRYLRLKARILGFDQLHYHDQHAPLLREAGVSYPWEDVRGHVLAALEPLGPSYTAVVERAFNERWLDVYPSEGKAAGAYSNGSAYDVHPYILLNYNGRYSDLSTVIHELGHTMHSYLSNGKQPYQTANYAIFVAEVASMVNEALLHAHVLKSAGTAADRLRVQGDWLEGVHTGLFRQALFAEFELRLHERAEAGQALTGDSLSELYLGLVRQYFGHHEGVCQVDDHVAAEWLMVHHFYLNFYTFQYSTSFTAATALAEKILAGDRVTTERFLEFLSSGGSDHPVELLKRTGVDMTTSAPMELTIAKMERVTDELERLVAEAE